MSNALCAGSGGGKSEGKFAWSIWDTVIARRSDGGVIDVGNGLTLETSLSAYVSPSGKIKLTAPTTNITVDANSWNGIIENYYWTKSSESTVFYAGSHNGMYNKLQSFLTCYPSKGTTCFGFCVSDNPNEYGGVKEGKYFTKIVV